MTLKHLYLLWCCAMLVPQLLVAQQAAIQNTRAESIGNNLLVKYDIVGADTLYNVRLDISTADGRQLVCRNLVGDVGATVLAGRNKQIIWNTETDNANLQGSEINITVVSDRRKHAKKEVQETIAYGRYTWSPIQVRTQNYNYVRGKTTSFLSDEIRMKTRSGMVTIPKTDISQISFNTLLTEHTETIVKYNGDTLRGRIAYIIPGKSVKLMVSKRQSVDIKTQEISELNSNISLPKGSFFITLNPTIGTTVGYLNRTGFYASYSYRPFSAYSDIRSTATVGILTRLYRNNNFAAYVGLGAGISEYKNSPYEYNFNYTSYYTGGEFETMLLLNYQHWVVGAGIGWVEGVFPLRLGYSF